MARRKNFEDQDYFNFIKEASQSFTSLFEDVEMCQEQVSMLMHYLGGDDLKQCKKLADEIATILTNAEEVKNMLTKDTFEVGIVGNEKAGKTKSRQLLHWRN